MLFPFTRVWTRRQKGLIVGSAVLALALSAALIYGYERYYRGPSEGAFFGIWETASDPDSLIYYEFRPDQTFSVSLSPAMDEESIFGTGRWYAGGPNIYIRFSADEIGEGTRPQVWHIVDIQPNEFRVRFFTHDEGQVYKRVRPAERPASNQTMQRTTGSLEFSPSMKSHPLPAATRSLASRR
jgi:hypothetical protein